MDISVIFLNAFLDAITEVSANLQTPAIARVLDISALSALLLFALLHAEITELAVVPKLVTALVLDMEVLFAKFLFVMETVVLVSAFFPMSVIAE